MPPKLRDVPLSVLDLVPVVAGSTAAAALRESVELAQHTERLGYHRYWFAEHHNLRGVAAAAPTVLIAHVAASTERIRVGSGGVMLPLHAPLLVAEQFGTLEVLQPGRIDLGVTRAAGKNPRTRRALGGVGGRRPDPEDFRRQIEELVGYFAPSPTCAGGSDTPEDPLGSIPGEDDESPVQAVPAVGNQPPLWLLGSSEASARLAGELGLPYAFAHHLKPRNTEAALSAYRSFFQPSPQLDRPHVMLSVSVIMADTNERAQWISAPSKLKWLRRQQHSPIIVPTPELAATYGYTESDTVTIDKGFADKFIGAPEVVCAGLQVLLDSTQADELMVTTRVHDPVDRRRSYELLSEARR